MASDVLNNELKEDIDDFIDMQLDTIQIAPIQVGNILPDDILTPLLEEQDINNSIIMDYYSICSRKYIHQFTTLQRPKDMTTDEFYKFKKKALKFIVHNKMLFK